MIPSPSLSFSVAFQMSCSSLHTMKWQCPVLGPYSPPSSPQPRLCMARVWQQEWLSLEQRRPAAEQWCGPVQEDHHGLSTEELCADPVQPRTRLSGLRIPAPPAAAGGGEGPLDEMAESGNTISGGIRYPIKGYNSPHGFNTHGISAPLCSLSGVGVLIWGKTNAFNASPWKHMHIFSYHL